MVLSAMVRTGQRFGPAHIIDIVVGAKTARISQLRHDRLPTYGVGAEHSKNQWRSIVRQMVAAGFIHLDIAEFGGLSVTEKGRLLLKGEVDFEYRAETLKPTRTTSKAKPVIDEKPLAEQDRTLLDELKTRSHLVPSPELAAGGVLASGGGNAVDARLVTGFEQVVESLLEANP